MPNKDKSEKRFIFLGIFFLAAVLIFSFDGWGAKLLASFIGTVGKPKTLEIEAGNSGGYYKHAFIDGTENNYALKTDAIKTPEELAVKLGGKIYSRSEIKNLEKSGFTFDSNASNKTTVENYQVRLNFNGPAADLVLFYNNANEILETVPVSGNAANSSNLVNLPVSGIWNLEVVWFGESGGNVLSYHVMKSGVQTRSDGGVVDINLAKNDAKNSITLNPVQPSGKELQNFGSVQYKFFYAPLGGGFNFLSPLKFGNAIMVSDLSASYNFAASAIAGDNSGLQIYLYELSNGIGGNFNLNNSAGDFTAKDLSVFKNRESEGTAVVYGGACLSSYLFDRVLPSNCWFSSYINLTGGKNKKVFILNNAPKDIASSRFPDYPFFKIALKLSGQNFSESQNYYFASGAGYGWVDGGAGLPNDPAPRNFFGKFKTETPPASFLPLGNAPLFDASKWSNFANENVELVPQNGFSSRLYLWSDFSSDLDAPANFTLKKDGKNVSEGTISSSGGLQFKDLAAGSYEFEIQRQAIIKGISTKTTSNSTFKILNSKNYARSPVDENPPALTGVRIIAGGFWQNLIDTTLNNQIVFSLDPVPGIKKQNNSYVQMPDSLNSVKLEVMNDGKNWRERTLTDLGNGKYNAVINVPGDSAPAGSRYSLKISAKDSANNSFSYVFEMPTGGGLKDSQAPVANINLPLQNSSVSGVASVEIPASDNLKVAKVELYKNNKLVDMKTDFPYIFRWNTVNDSDGDYLLQGKAYDIAGNIGSTVSVKVKVDNTPPTVEFDSPKENAVVLGTIVNIFGSVSDNSEIKKVDFYLDDNKLISSDTKAPFIFNWDSTSVSDGNHAITLKAVDGAGNVANSSPLNVVVENRRRGGGGGGPSSTSRPSPSPSPAPAPSE